MSIIFDCRRDGVTRSGLYILQSGGAKDDLDVSFCDMSKDSGDSAMQTNILPLLKKEDKVSFLARRDGFFKSGHLITGFKLLYSAGTFDSVFKSSQGVFTAPIQGYYQFTFSGTCSDAHTVFKVQKQGSTVFTFYNKVDSGNPYRACGNTFGLHLRKGEEVSLGVLCTPSAGKLCSSPLGTAFFFSGHLGKVD